MNKSYKCDFCAFDKPTTNPNEICEDCKLGSHFELKKRLSSRQADEWIIHRKVDKFLEDIDVDLLGYQKECMHQLVVVGPRHPLYPLKANDLMRENRRVFRDVIRSVKLDDEKEKENAT